MNKFFKILLIAAFMFLASILACAFWVLFDDNFNIRIAQLLFLGLITTCVIAMGGIIYFAIIKDKDYGS